MKLPGLYFILNLRFYSVIFSPSNSRHIHIQKQKLNVATNLFYLFICYFIKAAQIAARTHSLHYKTPFLLLTLHFPANMIMIKLDLITIQFTMASTLTAWRNTRTTPFLT